MPRPPRFALFLSLNFSIIHLLSHLRFPLFLPPASPYVCLSLLPPLFPCFLPLAPLYLTPLTFLLNSSSEKPKAFFSSVATLLPALQSLSVCWGKGSVPLYTDQFVIWLAVASPASPERDLGRLDALAQGGPIAYTEGLITRHSCAASLFFCCVIKEKDFSNYR